MVPSHNFFHRAREGRNASRLIAGSVYISRQGGFSLLELLAALGIVTVLCALLFPALGRMSENVKGTRCLSNLRQIQAANLSFAADNDGWSVPVFVNSSTQGGGRTWWSGNKTFFQYLDIGQNEAGLPQSLRCPLATGIGYMGYGMNSTGLSGSTSVPGDSRKVRLAQINQPTKKIAFADGLDYQLQRSAADSYQGKEQSTTQAIAYRHSKKTSVNIVFWDGHTESRLREDVVGNRDLWDLLAGQ